MKRNGITFPSPGRAYLKGLARLKALRLQSQNIFGYFFQKGTKMLSNYTSISTSRLKEFYCLD